MSKFVQLSGAVSVLLALGLVAGPTEKGKTSDPPKVDFERAFRISDKNRDGKLSKAEFTARWSQAKAATEKFDRADRNQDGWLSLEEYQAAGEKIVPPRFRPRPEKKQDTKRDKQLARR